MNRLILIIIIIITNIFNMHSQSLNDYYTEVSETTKNQLIFGKTNINEIWVKYKDYGYLLPNEEVLLDFGDHGRLFNDIKMVDSYFTQLRNKSINKPKVSALISFDSLFFSKIDYYADSFIQKIGLIDFQYNKYDLELFDESLNNYLDTCDEIDDNILQGIVAVLGKIIFNHDNSTKWVENENYGIKSYVIVNDNNHIYDISLIVYKEVMESYIEDEEPVTFSNAITWR